MTHRWLLLLALLAALGRVQAAPGLEEREVALATSLRCMVCQNQTLAESNAPLALDMRRQIHEQLAAGRSEAQIRDYFEERYGAFVRYDPPFRPSTWLLWLGPFALLLLGLAVLARIVRRRQRAAPQPLTPAERSRAAALLKGDSP
ncbi:cytochrome c-type biogenesis protein [Variovorax sp. OV329]|jgi:cytochrome c-type biogenesis protein CcmH|uniref:cytochrome c-type biogenesis protein n=1 Tax=Variovorax sp. OV329 TaxID=1882825 RepID=UPI0008F32206|nr:cytochrome c-type biogenesis protein [Variovorax sp. OV329]SFN43913.1 cytochrome c-type biogenesis protein CcmH [Variovorax sp. OV329]